MINDELSMRKVAIVFVLFFAIGDFVQAQNKNCFTLNFFGVKYCFDSLDKYVDFSGANHVYPNYGEFYYTFIGKSHIQRTENQTEDPINPETFFTISADTLTNKFSFWLIDTVKFNRLNVDSSFNITIGKKTYPVSDCKVAGDSMVNTVGTSIGLDEFREPDFYYTYYRKLVPTSLFYFFNNSNHSTKMVVTDIYYYDWDKKQKVKLDVSILIKR
jgi:hypothetical protein